MLKHIANDSKNKVAIKTNEGWIIDDSFYPFFYARCKKDHKYIDMYRRGGLIKDVKYVKKYILWDNPKKERVFLKVYTPTPLVVPRIAEKLSDAGIPVFASDIPYLFNYLLMKKKFVYKNVECLRTVIFDVECDNKYNVPFLICAYFGILDLTNFKFKKEYESVYDGKPIDNVSDFLDDLKKERIDLSVGHNVSFDWRIIVGYYMQWNHKLPNFMRIKKEKVFQGAFHGSELFYPKYIQNFDTLLAIGVSIPRPVSHNLKYIVSDLKLRGWKDRVYVNTRHIYHEWKRNRNNVIEYCLDDVEDTKLLMEYLAPSCFIPAIYSGVTVEQVLISGVKAIWEMLMMRECIKRNIIIPHFENKAIAREKRYVNPFLKTKKDLGKAKGGLVGKNIPKKYTFTVLKNVYNVDVTSDFPNITLQYNISPETVVEAKSSKDSIEVEFEYGCVNISVSEERGILPSVLEEINDIVVDLKKKKKKDPSLIPLYKGFKSIRDSHYSVSAIRRGQSRFTNRLSIALVHYYGRNILSTIIDELKLRGYEIVFSDTDGVLVYKDNSNDEIYDDVKEIEDILVERFGERFGKVEGSGLDIEKYDYLYILKPKNYIYKMGDEIGVKGTLTARYICYLERKGIENVFKGLFSSEPMMKSNEALFSVRKLIYESDEPMDFAFNIFLKKSHLYKDEKMKRIVERLGAGNSLVFVKRSAVKTPMPYKYYEPIENFTPEVVDRDWYYWHFKMYLLKDVCKLDLVQRKLEMFIR